MHRWLLKYKYQLGNIEAFAFASVVKTELIIQYVFVYA